MINNIDVKVILENAWHVCPVLVYGMECMLVWMLVLSNSELDEMCAVWIMFDPVVVDRELDCYNTLKIGCEQSCVN